MPALTLRDEPFSLWGNTRRKTTAATSVKDRGPKEPPDPQV